MRARLTLFPLSLSLLLLCGVAWAGIWQPSSGGGAAPISLNVTGAIGAYLAEHQLRTGPMFNIYRVSPAQNPDPSSWVTDVCFPILP